MPVTVTDWLQLILLAGIAGAVGQSARVIIGIKKVNDQASATNQSMGDIVQVSRLVISLLIGFVAGVLAMLVMVSGMKGPPTVQTILAFAAAGYTGADFIEGIMSRYEPTPPPAPPANGTRQPAPSANTHAG